MNHRLRAAGWSLPSALGPCAAVLAGALLTGYWPARAARDAARGYARARGYAVGDGGFADFVTQPDACGGCEVECTSGTEPAGTVAVRVRRPWVLGPWYLTA